MTKTSDKSADSQSETRISVAYNKNCHLSLMTSLVKLFISSSTCRCETLLVVVVFTLLVNFHIDNMYMKVNLTDRSLSAVVNVGEKHYGW